MATHVVDVFVDFVADDVDVLVAAEHLGQRLEFLLAVNGTRGVARRAEDDGLGAGRDGLFELGGRNLEVLFNAGLHEDGLAVGHEHHLRVAHPIGSGDDDFLARGDEGHDGIADTLLGTVGTNDLLGRIVQAVLVFQFVHHCLTEGRISGHGRVARIVVVHCLLRSFLDVVGRVEVGFADREINHIDPLGLELSALLRHGQGGGRRQTLYES